MRIIIIKIKVCGDCPHFRQPDLCLKIPTVVKPENKPLNGCPLDKFKDDFSDKR